MLVAFLDGTNTPKRGWFALGGIVIEGSKLLDLETGFLRKLRKAGVPIEDPSVNTEVKWSLPNDSWIRENLCDEKREELYKALLKHAFALDSKIIGAIFNWSNMTDRQTGRPYTRDMARDKAYEHVFERIQAVASDRQEVALVICDLEGDTKKTRERVKKTFELVRKGSPYKSLKNIYQHVWPVDSRYHAGIQVADLCMGITGCMVAGARKYAQRYWDVLRGHFLVLGNLDEPQKWGLSILPTPVREHFLSEYNPYCWKHRQNRRG